LWPARHAETRNKENNMRTLLIAICSAFLALSAGCSTPGKTGPASGQAYPSSPGNGGGGGGY